MKTRLQQEQGSFLITAAIASGILAILMFALLLIERLYITPEIIRLGRIIDFVPPADPPQRIFETGLCRVAWSVTPFGVG